MKRLFLEPNANATPEAIKAIGSADVICIGPGSFYTSVLPNFLPVGIKEAIQNSNAQIIFICNLLSEGRGMGHMGVEQLTSEVENCIGKSIDQVIVNNFVPTQANLPAYAKEQKRPLLYNGPKSDKFILAPLWEPGRVARHHSESLAYLVFKLLKW